MVWGDYEIGYNKKSIVLLGWYNIVSYVPDGLDIRVDCGVHHDDAFNFRGNNTLHIVKVLVAFFENDGIADDISNDTELNEAIDHPDLFALYVNDSWGVILKKQTDASTDIVHGVKFVRPLHLSTYHVTMSTFILGDMYLDPDVITITKADDCADVYLLKTTDICKLQYSSTKKDLSS